MSKQKLNLFTILTFFALVLVSTANPSKALASGAELPVTGPQSASRYLVTTQTPPRVIAQTESYITELPRTGVPLAVWALAALAPLGFKLKNKGRLKIAKNDSPAETWLERELKK